MVACHAHSPGVTPEETMVRRARLSPQTEGGPLVTLMDRNVAHPRTHSCSSHTLGANNAPSHGRGRAPPWTGGGALAALSQLIRCPPLPPVNKVSSQVYDP